MSDGKTWSYGYITIDGRYNEGGTQTPVQEVPEDPEDIEPLAISFKSFGTAIVEPGLTSDNYLKIVGNAIDYNDTDIIAAKAAAAAEGDIWTWFIDYPDGEATCDHKAIIDETTGEISIKIHEYDPWFWSDPIPDDNGGMTVEDSAAYLTVELRDSDGNVRATGAILVKYGRADQIYLTDLPWIPWIQEYPSQYYNSALYDKLATKYMWVDEDAIYLPLNETVSIENAYVGAVEYSYFNESSHYSFVHISDPDIVSVSYPTGSGSSFWEGEFIFRGLKPGVACLSGKRA